MVDQFSLLCASAFDAIRARRLKRTAAKYDGVYREDVRYGATGDATYEVDEPMEAAVADFFTDLELPCRILLLGLFLAPGWIERRASRYQLCALQVFFSFTKCLFGVLVGESIKGIAIG